MSQHLPDGYSEKFLIPNDLIQDNPWQTRALDLAKVLEKKESIREHGLLQPPLGRVVGPDGKPVDLYTVLAEGMPDGLRDHNCLVQIAFAHHRLAAYRELAKEDPQRWGRFPVFLQAISDEQMALFGWEENERHHELNFVQKARAIQRYMADFNWTQEQVAERIKMDRATVANKLRILKAPKEYLDAAERGEISERQLMALLPALELPPQALQKVEKADWNYAKPSRILKEIKEGTITSDQIRERVSSTINEATKDLREMKWLDATFEGSSFVSPTCAACASRVRKGKSDRCYRPDCFDAKDTEHERRQLAAISQQLGVPVASKGGNHMERDWTGDNSLAEKLYARRCPNLHIERDQSGVGFRGLGVRLVCCHPGTNRCKCLEEMREQHGAQVQQAEAQKRRKLSDEVIDPATRSLSRALGEDKAEAWLLLVTRITNVVYPAGKGGDANWAREQIARSLVKSMTNYTNDPDTARAHVEEALEGIGIVPPWKQEEGNLDAVRTKFARVQKWIAELFQYYPSMEALNGNIANLERIFARVQAESALVELVKPVAEGLRKLTAVRNVVKQWDGDGFEHVSWLMTVPPRDGNFKSALEQSNQQTVEYTLAILDTDQNKGKIEALQARLRKLVADQVRIDVQTPGKRPEETLVQYLERTDAAAPGAADGTMPVL